MSDIDNIRISPMSDAELIDLCNTSLECERAGVKALGVYAKDFEGNPEFVEAIIEPRLDERRYCKLMHDYLKELGAEITRKTDSFAGKVTAIEGKAERLTYLNRGHDWVAREIEMSLPKVQQLHIREGLQEMLDTHRENIRTCEGL